MCDDKKTEAITLKLSAHLLEGTDGVAKYRGMERSEYIRWLIEQDIERVRQGYEVLAGIFAKPKTGSNENHG